MARQSTSGAFRLLAAICFLVNWPSLSLVLGWLELGWLDGELLYVGVPAALLVDGFVAEVRRLHPRVTGPGTGAATAPTSKPKLMLSVVITGAQCI